MTSGFLLTLIKQSHVEKEWLQISKMTVGEGACSKCTKYTHWSDIWSIAGFKYLAGYKIVSFITEYL